MNQAMIARNSHSKKIATKAARSVTDTLFPDANYDDEMALRIARYIALIRVTLAARYPKAVALSPVQAALPHGVVASIAALMT